MLGLSKIRAYRGASLPSQQSCFGVPLKSQHRCDFLTLHALRLAQLAGTVCFHKHPCRIVWHIPSMNSFNHVEVYPIRICLAGAVNLAGLIEIPRLSRRVASLAAKLLRRSVKIATPLRFLDTPRLLRLAQLAGTVCFHKPSPVVRANIF